MEEGAYGGLEGGGRGGGMEEGLDGGRWWVRGRFLEEGKTFFYKGASDSC